MAIPNLKKIVTVMFHLNMCGYSKSQEDCTRGTSEIWQLKIAYQQFRQSFDNFDSMHCELMQTPIGRDRLRTLWIFGLLQVSVTLLPCVAGTYRQRQNEDIMDVCAATDISNKVALCSFHLFFVM